MKLVQFLACLTLVLGIPYAMIASCAATGCAPHTESRIVATATTIANGARVTIQNAETTAVLVYREQQRAAVLRIRDSGGTKEEAKAAVEQIRGEWSTRWPKFDAARKAHALLVETVEAYEAGTEVELPDGTRVPTLADLVAQSRELTKLYNEMADIVRVARE